MHTDSMNDSLVEQSANTIYCIFCLIKNVTTILFKGEVTYLLIGNLLLEKHKLCSNNCWSYGNLSHLVETYTEQQRY